MNEKQLIQKIGEVGHQKVILFLMTNQEQFLAFLEEGIAKAESEKKAQELAEAEAKVAKLKVELEASTVAQPTEVLEA
mgnify:CR=1 FL=1